MKGDNIVMCDLKEITDVLIFKRDYPKEENIGFIFYEATVIYPGTSEELSKDREVNNKLFRKKYDDGWEISGKIKLYENTPIVYNMVAENPKYGEIKGNLWESVFINTKANMSAERCLNNLFKSHKPVLLRMKRHR